MALTKQPAFTKKTTDLPDVPSPTYTPTQIKTYIQNPSDELMTNFNNAIDKLNSTTDGDSGADNIGATGFDGTASNPQVMLEDLNTRKADKGTDWTGTWHGFTPTQTDPGIQSQVDQNTSQLAETVTISGSGNDDTPTWNNALAGLANGGLMNLVSGDYHLNLADLKSNIIIHGRGFPRILSDNTIFSVNSGSPDVANNIKNIRFEYVTFEAITQTFSEFIHLLSLNGVSDVTFYDCIFKGFRGDGVYLGSGGSGEERHNENVHFEKCIFDGVLNQNRNGISIIDGDGVTVTKCIFKNCTASNMPGAIDIEPNTNAFSIIRNITIKKNKLKNIGGNAGAIGVYLSQPQSFYTNPIKNIEISGNVIYSTKDTQIGIQVRQVNTVMIDNQTPIIDVKIKNNNVTNCSHFGAFITGIRGFSLKNNLFENNANGVVLGSANENVNKIINGIIEENTFSKTTGSVTGGILLYSSDNMRINNNDFIDCHSSGIVFTTGTSSHIELIDNTFISPTGLMTVATEKRSDHTFTPSTNIDRDNNYNGLINQFLADLKDYLFKTTYDTTKLPESFVLGEEWSMVDGDLNLPSASKQGILKTIRPITTGGAYNKYTIQWFYPANNDSTTLSTMYFRKGLTSNAWSAWFKLTGV